MQLVGAF